MTEAHDPKPYRVHPDFDPHNWDNEIVVCSYCLHGSGDNFDRGLKGDGDTTEMECEECGQVSIITMSVSIDYKTAPIDPEVPRRPFPVTLHFDGWVRTGKLPHDQTPSLTIIRAIIARGRDPFSDGADYHGYFQLETAYNDVLGRSIGIAQLGVRPGDHLFIKRKPAPEPPEKATHDQT